MATVHRLKEVFLVDETFALIAVHSTLADYALTYSLNQALHTRLVRQAQDWQIAAQVAFGHFQWYDDSNEAYWDLWANRCMTEENSLATDLFSGQPASTWHYLVPEHKEAHFIMKIDGEDTDQDQIAREIAALPGVQTAYGVAQAQLKSIDNLIN